MYSPLDQFKIEWLLRIYNYRLDLTISNITIYIGYSVILIIMGIIIIQKRKIIGNNYQRGLIMVYRLLDKQLLEIIGNKGKKYLPFLSALFFFILISNLIGLIPYSTVITSQIILTFTLSLSIFLGVTYLGISLHGYKFYKLFVPENVPMAILPLIVIIEIISYFARIISLSVRLAANLMSSHCLTAILCNLSLNIMNYSSLLIFIPITLLFFIFLLEISVCVIQASVFVILTASYIKDALYLH